MSKTIQVDEAPNFDLPFSHAVECGDFVYVSGQVGVNPSTLELVGDTVEEQTRQCLLNIDTILHKLGLTLDHIVKMQAFLSRREDGPGFNQVYRQVLKEPYPARSTIQCGIGKYLVEIDAVAYKPSVRNGNKKFERI